MKSGRTINVGHFTGSLCLLEPQGSSRHKDDPGTLADSAERRFEVRLAVGAGVPNGLELALRVERREKLYQLPRLVTYCERNYNYVELGPKGAGPSPDRSPRTLRNVRNRAFVNP